MTPVETPYPAKRDEIENRLRGKTSVRKGWLLLAAAADWWCHASRPWAPALGETGVWGWRELIRHQAERQEFTRSPVRDRLVPLVDRFKDRCVEVQDFEAAACWLDVRRTLEGSTADARSGQVLLMGALGFPEMSMPPADLLALLDDLFADHLHDVRLDPAWLAWQQGTAVAIARRIYDGDDFRDLPVLADALEDAGCVEPLVLDHCRNGKPHARGCWVVDWCLGKT